jgi:hypothetical protein
VSARADAEGRSNAGTARRLWVTEGTVEKHVRSILAKLNLPEAEEDHRRVLAVVPSSRPSSLSHLDPFACPILNQVADPLPR